MGETPLRLKNEHIGFPVTNPKLQNEMLHRTPYEVFAGELRAEDMAESSQIYDLHTGTNGLMMISHVEIPWDLSLNAPEKQLRMCITRNSLVFIEGFPDYQQYKAPGETYSTFSRTSIDALIRLCEGVQAAYLLQSVDAATTTGGHLKDRRIVTAKLPYEFSRGLSLLQLPGTEYKQTVTIYGCINIDEEESRKALKLITKSIRSVKKAQLSRSIATTHAPS